MADLDLDAIREEHRGGFAGADIRALANEAEFFRNALADVVVKATEYGEQDGGFVASYLLPTGPIHRAIASLQERGITVRPGFDGRQAVA